MKVILNHKLVVISLKYKLRITEKFENKIKIYYSCCIYFKMGVKGLTCKQNDIYKNISIFDIVSLSIKYYNI